MAVGELACGLVAAIWGWGLAGSQSIFRDWFWACSEG